MEVALESKRTRGPNKQAAWSRDPAAGVSVLRLALDASDPLVRKRLEGIFGAAFSLRRALQRDARNRVEAYWAARNERAAKGPAAVRERLGLSRDALERAAYRHLDGAAHLRAHATKAMAMHLADSVWAATERHLFADSRGDDTDPGTAVVDYAAAAASLEHAATRELLRSTLDRAAPGRQDALSELTASNALDGSSAGETWRTPTATRLVARRIVGMAPRPTPDETVASRRTTPDRARMRTDLSQAGGIRLSALRDSS